MSSDTRTPQPIHYEPSSGASSESGEDSDQQFVNPRARAPKFAPGPAESNAILYQLCTDIPYSHSRNGQKSVWNRHLTALKDAGHCLVIPLRSYKTLVKWTNDVSKARSVFRAKEKRTSGLATIAPAAVIDTVADYWKANKVVFTTIFPRTYYAHPRYVFLRLHLIF